MRPSLKFRSAGPGSRQTSDRTKDVAFITANSTVATTLRITRRRFYVRASSAPPPSRLPAIGTVSQSPFLPLPHSPPPRPFCVYSSVLQARSRNPDQPGSCLSFLSLSLLLRQASAVTFRLLPRILCFRIESIPATVGSSSNQPPLPSSLWPLPIC